MDLIICCRYGQYFSSEEGQVGIIEHVRRIYLVKPKGLVKDRNNDHIQCRRVYKVRWLDSHFRIAIVFMIPLCDMMIFIDLDVIGMPRFQPFVRGVKFKVRLKFAS